MKSKLNCKIKDGLCISDRAINITVDSGACDAVCPPGYFVNTETNTKNHDYGHAYGACGGETVRNIGSKFVQLSTETGTQSYEFQIGDKLTKPLLAVSKICESGKAVFFGPGPRYESYILNDPEAIAIGNGTKTSIVLHNGTYISQAHEAYKAKGSLGPIDDDTVRLPQSSESQSSNHQSII